MKTKTSLLFLPCIWIAAYSSSFGATIPSGTTLNVRTVDPIMSSARVGRTYKAELAHDVAVNGNVILRRGTPCSVVVETSFGDVKRSSALTLNLTNVSANGRTVSVKTTGGYELGAGMQTARRNVSVYGRNYTYPHGTRMTFRLAQPLNV
jgi:hypothetical protein